ncbi:Nonsense-mediated mRNA decay protein 2 [Aphelenchoides besseyi]|nr:Nonsense-mediated mRNA decay protein 2 [Aphelenchoides besseyi]
MENLSSGIDFKSWHEAVRQRRAVQERWIEYSNAHSHYDEDAIRRLDSTLKKVTAFMKRVKNIGTTVTPESLLPELAKLNLSKFVDEIASSVCDAKIKVEELPSLVEFCVKAGCMYATFAENLTIELRKRVPTKRSDKIANASKLRVDLKFIAELILNGVLKTEGLQLIGSLLSYLINTDKQEHVNVPILLPFCQTDLFECSAMIPLSCQRSATENELEEVVKLLPDTISKEQRGAMKNLLKTYMESLVEHVNTVRLKMNTVLKSIKRQERTRGDAAAEDRQSYDELKTTFDRLLNGAMELSQWVGIEVPEMPEELSDDEVAETEVKKTNGGGSGRVLKFVDEDTLNVEHAALLARNTPTMEDDGEQETEDFGETNIEVLVDNINLEDLESEDDAEVLVEVPETEEQIDEEVPATPTLNTKTEANRDSTILNPMDNVFGVSSNFTSFLIKLCNAINKERIDAAALEFITSFNKASNRKRLIQHLLAAPYDRLDLLPFYCRFMATINAVVPAVPRQVGRTLLERFREIANRKCVVTKTKGKNTAGQHIDAKVHLSKFISEMVKFGLLPKAEGLACLRALLVDLRQYKVDMFSAMIESMGYFLYNSPETHGKMKLLLENAYFAVLPTEDDSSPLQRRPPIEEFISMKIMTLKSVKSSLHALRRIDWEDEETCEFALRLLCNPCTVPFVQIERLAKLVGNLTDYQPWVGIYVVDDVLEFIRMALELNDNSLYQRLFSSVVYIGQLFNYTICGTAVIFKVMYQLISFNINVAGNKIALDCALRSRRIRLAIELVRTVGEYFVEGRPKERMDCFLNYLFLFYFDTKECWSAELVEEYGEFPQELAYEMDKMLTTFRKKEKSKFPNSLEAARKAVQKIQEKYLERAHLLYQQTGQLTQPEPEQEEAPRKGKNNEEDDDEDIELTTSPQLQNADEPSASPGDSKLLDRSTPPLTLQFQDHKFSVDEEVKLNGFGAQHEAEPEDEDLLRDLDRVMNETYQAAAVVQRSANIDLEVPPAARQKFERKITFAEETKGHADSDEQPSAPRVQMALMTRKGNRKVLKAVNVAPSQGMHEALLELRAQDAKERRELKALTGTSVPLNQPLPRVTLCQGSNGPPQGLIPAGPQRLNQQRYASSNRDGET